MDFSQAISEHLLPPARTNHIELRYGTHRGHRQRESITNIPTREMQRRFPQGLVREDCFAGEKQQATPTPQPPPLPLSTVRLGLVS